MSKPIICLSEALRNFLDMLGLFPIRRPSLYVAFVDLLDFEQTQLKILTIYIISIEYAHASLPHPYSQ